MTKRVLITGGAGFIGAHVSDELLRTGYSVRALDSLVPQVHGSERKRPTYLSSDVELVVGDVRDASAVESALSGVDMVIHLASIVGVGQSMYQIAEYTSVNNLGTAQLLQALSRRPVERLVVASSMSIYGEGLYRDVAGKTRSAPDRSLEQLRMGRWEIEDENGNPLTPIPTPESKSPALASVYALSKFDQEQMSLVVGRAYGIPAVALRFFNTYGPYQALSNPYTGVLSNFASRVLNGQAPLIFEDGMQMRDFVSVYDVARACRMALLSPRAAGEAMNISSGKAITVKEAAEKTIAAIGERNIKPDLTGKYRVGDIRHCFADVSRAKAVMGWEPKVSLQDGVEDLARWLDGQTATDLGIRAREELSERGLMV